MEASVSSYTNPEVCAPGRENPPARAAIVYSYLAVALAGCLGAAFPGAMASVLGPVLVVGLVGLGVAHGACDQLVLPACQLAPATGWRYQLGFGAAYLGLAGAVGLAWWWWPGAAVGLFFALSAWHWGSADAPAHPQRAVWVVHSLLRGALLLALPAAWWPAETAQHINGLLAMGGAAPVVASGGLAAAGLVLGGHLLLWGYFGWQQKPGRWHRDALEVGLLVGLFGALPPLLGLGVYFVFWHSLQHVLRLAPLLGYRAAQPGRPGRALGQELLFFMRRAWPMLAVSAALLAGAYALLSAWLPANAWLGLAVLGAAVITLPHALLVSVVMDAPKWRPRATRVA